MHFTCTCVLPAPMSVAHAFLVPVEGRKFQMDMSQNVGALEQIHILCKGSQCSKPLNYLVRPFKFIHKYLFKCYDIVLLS